MANSSCEDETDTLSVTNFKKVKSKLLFISIANPFLLEVEELKYALYPDSEVTRLCISSEKYVSCKQ